MNTWAENLYHYYAQLQPPENLPKNIHWLFPQQDAAVLTIVQQFLHKYYNDNHTRTLLLGINPGRFGAGVTGINFTAPKQLTEQLHLSHPYKHQTELSAEFIYSVIEKYGGVDKFYSHFFIGAVCPLGFVLNGKNLNYYDDKELLKTVEPFIIESLSRLVSFPVNRDICLCIGGEKNFRYLQTLNQRFHWFLHIEALPHPRFIMQYKRKKMQEYLDLYVHHLSAAAH